MQPAQKNQPQYLMPNYTILWETYTTLFASLFNRNWQQRQWMLALACYLSKDINRKAPKTKNHHQFDNNLTINGVQICKKNKKIPNLHL